MVPVLPLVSIAARDAFHPGRPRFQIVKRYRATRARTAEILGIAIQSSASMHPALKVMLDMYIFVYITFSQLGATVSFPTLRLYYITGWSLGRSRRSHEGEQAKGGVGAGQSASVRGPD